MAALGTFKDIAVDIDSSTYVALVEIRRPPHNFFDFSLIQQIADALDGLDRESSCRAVVLAAEGKSFCAGANFSAGAADAIGSSGDPQTEDPSERFRRSGMQLYTEATRLFGTRKPIVGAIQGPAIGGGLGLAMVPDFRICAPEARFSANFPLLGFHHGFGLTASLPRVIGQQRATLMLYTGRRIKGDEAVEWGLAEQCVPLDQVRQVATELAAELAGTAPLALAAIRASMRQGLAEAIKAATDRELQEQAKLMKTSDFQEGIKSTSERRKANFTGA